MENLISHSHKTLLFETLPAIKITEYYGTSKYDNIYSYLKMYEKDGDIEFSLTAFERNPSEDSALGLVLSMGNSEDNIRFEAFSNGKNYCKNNSNEFIMNIDTFKGSDQMGFYWGVSGVITKDMIAKTFNTSLNVKDIFYCNAFKFNANESAFGSLSKMPLGAKAMDNVNLGTFLIVSY